MVRDYQQHKARKASRDARRNSQPIRNMFARAANPAAAAAQAVPAAAAEEGTVDVEQEPIIETNDSTANDGGGGDGGGGDVDGDDGDDGNENNDNERSWQPHTLKLFEQMTKDIDKSVRMTGSGSTRRPLGKFPSKWKGLVSPSNDPLSFFEGSKISCLDFCHPNIFVWYPEAQWYQFYQHQYARPCCKWHSTHLCVNNDGWMDSPRHAYCMGTEVAVLGRKYLCTQRRDEGKTPYRFRGIDRKVIEQSPDYPKMQYERNGFDFSHRSGISNETLELGRRCVIGGLSANGFQHVMLQTAKQHHLIQSVLFRSWAQTQEPNLIYTADDIRQLKREFPEFDSDEYQHGVPSVSYFISRLILRMESSDEYKKRRMQMIDGLHVSGDHSFKVVKCMWTRGRPFTAVYCLLNEYSQVVGWWMTTGTSMSELEEPLRKLKQRYNIHGYDGPESATTDRCCQERAMWNKFLGPFDNEPANSPHLQPGDTTEIEVVEPPFNPRFARVVNLALVLVGEISEHLAKQPPERQVIIVDGEWERGKSKMDLLIIGLLSGQIFIFHLAQMCRRGATFPLALKILLEDTGVKKVGNRICSDKSKLVEWGVNLAPTVELGHLTKARGLSPTKNPSLAYLCENLFPGVVIEGKDQLVPGPRLSNWANPNLTQEQLAYANADGYLTTMIYKETMRHMDPRVEGNIHVSAAVDGLAVVLYLRSWKRVAEGVIRQTQNRTKVIVEIDLGSTETLYCRSAMVHVVNTDGSVEMKSIDSLCSNINEDESSIIKIIWDLSLCRKLNLAAEDTPGPVKLNTTTKQIVIEENSDDEDDEVREAQNNNYDADDEENNGGGEESDTSESDGENDTRRSLPRNRRRRLHHFRKQRVKNDIAHIFFRYQRVLSKEHGAYFSYITALRDAFFILNDEDLEECLRVLREKHNMSEEEIRKKMVHNFKWFLLRVRRLVPPPPDLAKRYLEVYYAHKDIICNKSGKELFATREAMAVHKAALKHIRRNCLSDIPLMSYYTPINKDRDGLTRWRCHRGTPGNEGLHQKLRQLVRGFSNSPRFLKAIISEFLLMWNQNIDVKSRGLPSKYYGLYDGQLLEDEIEKVSAFLDEPSHPEWVSSKSLQCTGESFGIINPTQAPTQIVADSDADDTELNMMAEVAADDLSDDELDAGLEAAIKMPPSSSWLAKLTGRNRPTEKVRSHEEWEFFKENVVSFQGGGEAGEADNYSGIRWSSFAESWNKWVDTLKHSKPTVTYKSASHLQDAYKSMKRRAVQQATLRPHTQTIRELRSSHTNREAAVAYLPEFAQPEPPTVAQPFVDATDTVDQDQAPNYDGDSDEPERAAAPQPRRKHNARARCRMCGKQYAHEDWKAFHQATTRNFNGKTLRDNDKKIWNGCKVPEEQYEPGFPFLDLTKRMPKRKRK